MNAKIFSSFVYVLIVLSLISTASAIEVLDESQDDITLILEQGSEYEFPLLIHDISGETLIKSEGKIDDWISIWGESEMKIFPGNTFVRISINVPEEADLGEYTGEVTADGKTLSFFTIKVTPKYTEVIAHESLSSMDEEVGTLGERVLALTTDIGELRTQIAVLEDDINKKVEEIYQYQKDLDALEKEREELEASYESLQEDYSESEAQVTELNEITGALVGTQMPGMLIGGILLGIILTIFLINRQKVKRKVVKRFTGNDPGDDKNFRYSYKPK